MNLKNKKRAAKRFKKQAKPVVIHINGLYIETSPDVISLFDFVRMITHSVDRETSKGGAA